MDLTRNRVYIEEEKYFLLMIPISMYCTEFDIKRQTILLSIGDWMAPLESEGSKQCRWNATDADQMEWDYTVE